MKFNEYYVIVRDEYVDTCKSFLLKDSPEMLHYYGVGGIGKTTLKNTLINNLSSENDLVLNIDFEFYDNWKIAVVLEKLRSQILQYKKSSRFPRFDYAIKIYYEKTTPQYVLKDRHTLPLPDESEIIANALDEVEKINIPMISTLPKIAQTGYRYMKSIRNWLDIRNMEDLKNINQLEVEEIENLLLDLWLSDVIELNQNNSLNMIFLMDTFEKVGELIEGKFKLTNSFMWLGRLMEKSDFCKFITFGREKIEGIFHNKRVEPVLIEKFNFQDTKVFLKKYYIGNDEFAKVFYNATEGIPYYLQLAIKTYNNINRTRIPKIEDFEGDRKLVVERFIRYLDEKEKNMLEVLSIPNFWNESLYNYLFDYDENIYRINRMFLEESSLIYFNELEGYWTMHELMRTHLLGKLIEEKNYFYKLNKKFYDFYNENMKNPHDKLSTYENMLKQYFYHSKLCENSFEFALNTIEYVKTTHVKSLITLAEDIAFYIETTDIPLKEVILYRLYFNINFSYLERMELEQANIWLEKNEVLFETQDNNFKELNFINHINLKAFNALTNKKFNDAEQLYLSLITIIKENQLEEEYKDLIPGIYNHLSVVFTQLDEKEKSEHYSNMALKNDLSDPEIAAVTLINASSTDLMNNNYSKALEKLDSAFELFEKSSEINERNYLVALSNKAEAYRGLKEVEYSFELHTEVLNKRISLLGSTHFDVADSYAGIGFLLREQGKLEESNNNLKESLLILRNLSNRNVLTIYDSLVKNYYDMKDFQNYLESLKEKLDHEQILFGNNSLNTLETLYEILDADDIQFILTDKLIEIYKENKLIIDDQHLIKLLNYVKKKIKAGKNQEAMSLLMKIKDTLIINYTIAEAEVLFFVAKCNELDNNFPKAELNLKRALKIYESLRSSDHFDIGATHYQLGEVYANLNDFKRVKKHFKIALPILEKLEEAQIYTENIRQVLMKLK